MVGAWHCHAPTSVNYRSANFQELLSLRSRINMAQVDPMLLIHIQKAIGGLELDPSDRLRQSVAALSENPPFRIAVFAPFNYGKSTLLNAILGERTLPIDLIPTTGAAIAVHYGPMLQTQIRFVDGRTLKEPGTELLKQFAILDNQRRMRGDVAEVDVWCPHPWLQTGVELLDLPGTNDRRAQDTLVQEALLSADLVVQILDGRKLMTLGEREHLRDWLQDRGIETVVFVVNFLNLLEPEEQTQVSQRMRFVAESFRSRLPPGISNLYRVDALPALRSRLKGDAAAAQSSGLPIFEAALHTIVQTQRDPDWQPARLTEIAHKVRTALSNKIERLSTELEAEALRQSAHRLGLKQRAQTLLRQGYEDSIIRLRHWISLTNLVQQHGGSLSEALAAGEFQLWEAKQFHPAWDAQRQSIIEWVRKSSDFFDLPRPADLWITFPPEPSILPSTPDDAPKPKSNEAAPVAIATGLGLVMGGPVGAAVLGGASYLLNQISAPKSTPPIPSQLAQSHRDIAFEYLKDWQQRAEQALDAYDTVAATIINCPLVAEPTENNAPQHQLQFLRSTLLSLEECLESYSRP
jgi:Dynamin family